MDHKEIKRLIQLMQNGGLSVLEIKEGDTSIRLEKGMGTAAASAPVHALPPVPAAVPELDAGVVDLNNVREIRSPMVGVFYAAPSPEATAFCQRGSKVKKGDVLCVIEAMKLFNEITSDFEGEVVDICAENGQLVEFGQVLFKIY